MKYAKCIRGCQIAKDKKEFCRRQNEEYNVYCEGEITKAKEGQGDLYCVPLNYIYDCLKYGEFIAIIDIEDDEPYHLKNSSYLPFRKISREQKITKILKADCKETIDFVFNEVGDPSLIKDGYVHTLPKEIQEYFYNKMRKIF